MATNPSKLIFSEEMFEQALAQESWNPLARVGNPSVVTQSEEPVEASEQLAGLARNVADYGVSAFEAIQPAVEPASEPGIEPPAMEAEAVFQWRMDRPGDRFAVLNAACPEDYIEQFQLLRTQLLLLRAQLPAEDGLRSICLTSAVSREGKTFTTRNLAATLATNSAKKVLIVETGVRDAELPESVLSLEAIMAAPELWRRGIAEIPGLGLSILTGPKMGSHADFEALPAVLAAVRPHFDWVLIDGLAIQSSGSAEWVAAAADATLFVVRQGGPSFDNLADALSRVPRERLAGVVMNRLAAPKSKSWFPRVRIRIPRARPV